MRNYLIALVFTLTSHEIESYILHGSVIRRQSLCSTLSLNRIDLHPKTSRIPLSSVNQDSDVTDSTEAREGFDTRELDSSLKPVELDVHSALADIEDVVTDFLNQDGPVCENTQAHVSEVLEISKEKVQEFEALQIPELQAEEIQRASAAAATAEIDELEFSASEAGKETPELEPLSDELDQTEAEDGTCLILTEQISAVSCISAEDIETTEIGSMVKQEKEQQEQMMAKVEVVNDLYKNPSEEKVTAEDLEQDQAPVPQTYNTPGTKELLLFTIPTLAMWLAGPIMSMVDTSVVGRHNSLELAALGPATHVCDSALYMFSFLGCATSNFVATAIASGDEKELQKAVSHSLAMAVTAGATLILLVQVFGPWLLAGSAGPKAAEVVPAALTFLRARIWGAMAVLVSIVGQATSLGMKDSVTPLRVVALSAFINLFGDIFLVMKAGKGIFGAAVATAGAEIIGAAAMIYTVQKKLGERLYPVLKFPPMAELKQFFSLAGPLFASLVGKTVIYTLTTMAVSSTGTFSLAAHQVVLRVFFLFTTFGDALAQTIQSYLPFYTVKAKTEPAAKVAERGLVKRMIRISAIAGSLNALVATLIPLKLHGIFTSDPMVVAKMLPMAPLAGIALVTHAVVMSLEGIIISKRDVNFLSFSYLFNTVFMVGYLSLIKVVPFFAKRLAQSAWAGLVLFQCLRLAQYGARVWQLQKKADAAPVLAN